MTSAPVRVLLWIPLISIAALAIYNLYLKSKSDYKEQRSLVVPVLLLSLMSGLAYLAVQHAGFVGLWDISSISGETVYFYQQFLESALTAEPEKPQSLRDSNLPVSWDQIQTKYRITSQKLAKLIQYQLNNVRQPPDTKIQGAPLLVLEGADMPAVAIEIGNLSNPNEEKTLGDTEFLAVIARAIAKGIDAFFAQK